MLKLKFKLLTTSWGLPITRQIHYIPTLIHQEMINKLGLSCTIQSFKPKSATPINPKKKKLNFYFRKWEIKTWFLRCKSNFLLSNQWIDKRRLAHIRPPQNRKLRPMIFGALLGLPTALHKHHLLNPRLTRVGSDNDVGVGQDHFLCHLFRVNPRRHKQDCPYQPGGIGDWSALGSLRGWGRGILGRVAAGPVWEMGWERECERSGFRLEWK